jgi:hypothetical protein
LQEHNEVFRRGAPIQCRIYDNGKEVMKEGMKLWFLEVWGLDHCSNVWRIEFQLRRSALRQYHIESVADLLAGVRGIWRDLTENWLSVRVPDDSNTSRQAPMAWTSFR